MRLKTLQQAVNAMKAEDPDTVLNRSMLLRLIADGILPCEMHGNRHIVDYDRVKRCLCDRLMLRDSRFGPHLRTVETAMRELRKKQPELGFAEGDGDGTCARRSDWQSPLGCVRGWMDRMPPSEYRSGFQHGAMGFFHVQSDCGYGLHQAQADALLDDILKRGAKTVKPKRA